MADVEDDVWVSTSEAERLTERSIAVINKLVRDGRFPVRNHKTARDGRIREWNLADLRKWKAHEEEFARGGKVNRQVANDAGGKNSIVLSKKKQSKMAKWISSL